MQSSTVARSPIEESYELSPTQKGMLFHALTAPASGVDVEQIIVNFHEPLDRDALRRAWERVVDRHPILRTRFRWEGFADPVQEVMTAVTLPFEVIEGPGLDEPDEELWWSRVLVEDRKRGFDLSQAPLLRITVAPRGRDGDRHDVLWTFHHALLDGRSFPLVLEELLAAYDALRAGRGWDPPLPRPYGDFIRWLAVRDRSGEAAFWRERLRGFRAATPFPVLRDRGETTAGRPGSVAESQGEEEILLSAPSTESLRAFAEAEGVTINTLLQGAWALLLWRSSGEEDVLFGATRACRHVTVEGADTMIGLFINTLPLRVAVTPEAFVGDWLRALRAEQVALRPFEHTPLYDVQGWSEVPRGRPLFESLVVFESYRLDARMRATAGPTRHFTYRGQTNYPLTVVGYDGPELVLRIEYDRGRFDAAAIQRVMGHLRTLLEALPAHAKDRLHDVPMVAEAERCSLIALGSAAAVYVKSPALHARFEAQAARTPDAVALVCGDAGEERLTYDALNRRANQLAHRLRDEGVCAETLVGLCAERSAALVVGILGILKAGGAYLPLDPAYPQERLAFMLQDSGARAVVTERKLAGVLRATADEDAGALPVSPPLVFLEEIGDEPDGNLASITAPEHLAYVIYTSGSTGTPKGVLISHGNVVRLFEATNDWFSFGPRDVWTLFHSFAFDFSVWELWGALLYGGRLVVVPYWVSRSPEAFLEMVARERVTVLNQTPSAFRQLVAAQEALDKAPALALRLVIFGGEALELQSLRPWLERHGDQCPRLINMYGITETTVHVTYRPIGWDDVESGLGSVIGIPLPDLSLHVLDPYGEPAPIGVAGEMYVGGAGVARGYLNRDRLTTERFVPDRLGDGGGRLYRSGDLARRLPSGDIEYLGRIDHQVKIRGFRIELGEIEAQLSRHADVREAVVLAREDVAGERRLVAYVVLVSERAAHATGAEQPLLFEELRQLLRQRLPDYMVPAAFVVLEQLPLTTNGKIDRKALPPPPDLRPVSRAYAAPRDDHEAALARVWGEVLRLPQVGIDDNFFELGGDSILSIQVVARARQAGLALTPRELFAHPTIAELAPLLRAAAGTRASPMDGKDEEEAARPAPLTPIQRWFFAEEFAQPDHWNQAFLFETPADLDGVALERALLTLARRHDALRMRFERHDGAYVQIEGDAAAAIAVQRIDASDVADEAVATTLEAAAEALHSKLSLARGPLVRAAYISLGPARPGRLLLVVHHLAVDGVSWRILREDLETAYLEARAGETATSFTPGTTSYRRWATRLGEYAAHLDWAAEREHWLAFGRRSAFRLPPDLPADAAAHTEATTESVTLALSADETRGLLQDLPPVHHTQINDALLAALGEALRPFAGGEAVRIELEGHGREDVLDGVDLSRTVGWFTTIYPVELPLCGRFEPRDALISTKERLREIPARGFHYGIFRHGGADAEAAAALAEQPRPDVLFNYLGQIDQIVAGSTLFRLARESTGPWHGLGCRRTHPLEVIAQVVDGRLEVVFQFSRARNRRSTIQGIADRFVEALRALVAYGRVPGVGGYTPSDFPLAALDQRALDAVLLRVRTSTGGDAQDIYPLSPMQALFHSLEGGCAARGVSAGFEQWQFEINGTLDPSALRQAWESVIARHPILRTAFVSAPGGRTVQVVVSLAPLVFRQEDLRDKAPDEQRRRCAALLQADREEGFDLERPPLMRVTLVEKAPERHLLIWSTHHLYIDGWSWPLVFRDLSQAYEAAIQGQTPRFPGAPACPYRAFVDFWLRQRAEEHEKFWREELRGLSRPTPLDFGDGEATVAAGDAPGEEIVTLDAADTAALQDSARRQQITTNTVIAGAWAVLLRHLSGDDDVVFGAAVSGRPPEIPHVDVMVGPCVNDVPVRVQVRPEVSVSAWLKTLQARQAEVTHHQYVAPAALQSWSGLGWRRRLFESLLVFQNYLVDDAAGRLGSALLRPVSTPESTTYGLTLSATPASELALRLLYDRRRMSAATARAVLGDLRRLLVEVTRSPDLTVGVWAARLSSALQGRTGTVAARAEERRRALHHCAVTPATDIERTVLALWQELFGTDAIDLDENFFDLGGHSLLLVQAHARLRSALSVDLPIVALLQHPTVRTLAAHLGGGPPHKDGLSTVQSRIKKQRQALAKRQERKNRIPSS